MKKAGIYIEDKFCGVLTEDDEGYHFQYDSVYMSAEGAKALSPTMPFQTEERKSLKGFDRKSFIDAMSGSGISEKIGNKLIDRLMGCCDKWFGIIDISFLSDSLKFAYRNLIRERLGRIG